MINDRNVLPCNCNYSLMLMILMKHSTRSTVDLFNVVRKIAKITTCIIDRWESRSVRVIFFYFDGYIDLGLRPRLICFPRTNAKYLENICCLLQKCDNIIIYNYFYTKMCIKRYKKASIQVYYLVWPYFVGFFPLTYFSRRIFVVLRSYSGYIILIQSVK